MHAWLLLVCALDCVLSLDHSFMSRLHPRLQVGVVGEDRKFRILSEQEVKDFLDEAN